MMILEDIESTDGSVQEGILSILDGVLWEV
jgi:hypothetical protein